MNACPHCYQYEADCTCAAEWSFAALALGIGQPVTLADVAAAELAEQQYKAAMLEYRIRIGYHYLENAS